MSPQKWGPRVQHHPRLAEKEFPITERTLSGEEESMGKKVGLALTRLEARTLLVAARSGSSKWQGVLEVDEKQALDRAMSKLERAQADKEAK